MATPKRRSLSSYPPSVYHTPPITEQHNEKGRSAVVQVTPISYQYEHADTLPYVERTGTINAHDSGDSDLPLDQLLKFGRKQTPFVKGVVLSIISGIPFFIFLLVALYALPKNTKIGPPSSEATISELARWLFISWANFVGLLWCGRLLASGISWCCAQSKGSTRFQRLAEAVCLRVVMMVWALVCYALIPKIFHHSIATGSNVSTWVDGLRKIFKFISIAFAILIVQGFILGLASVRYIQGYMGPRSREAFNGLNTIKQLNTLIKERRWWPIRIIHKLFVPAEIEGRDLYHKVLHGEATEEDWAKYAANVWRNFSQVNGAGGFTRNDMHCLVTRRKIKRGNELVNSLFRLLDKDGSMFVTQDEVEALVRRVGRQLNMRGKAQHGIKILLRKLEILLTIVMFGVIIFLYVQFFHQKYTTSLTTFWQSITALSFAVGGVFTDFVNSCTFVFGKHPYDVGDYIEVKGKKLIVHKIHLTYTNFEEVAGGNLEEMTNAKAEGVVIQMSHSSLLVEPITNWTRTSASVYEQRKEKAKADEAVQKIRAEHENQEKTEARELISLKMALLKSKLE